MWAAATEPNRWKQGRHAHLRLVSGLPCSGNTTYAVGLRADANCVLFSLDRWLIASFGRYSIASVGHEEHARLEERNAQLPRYDFHIDPETLQGFLGCSKCRRCTRVPRLLSCRTSWNLARRAPMLRDVPELGCVWDPA